MAIYAALIPELEDAIRHGSAAKRADMADRVTDLFLDAADRFDAEQIAFFDEILGRLFDDVELKTLAGISRRLALAEAVPIRLVRRLAGNEAIAVAGPVLRESPCLLDPDLIAVANRMGPPHLLAIAQRPILATPVTDVLVERGDNRILQVVAVNRGARFSNLGFGVLVRRATGDDRLIEAVGLRPDIPALLLRDLVRDAPSNVRQQLIAAANASGQSHFGPVAVEAAANAEAKIATAYHDVLPAIVELERAGKLNEAQLRGFAKNGQFDKTVATLAVLSQVPVEVVDRLLRGDRLDGLLILGRAIGAEWHTVRAVVVLRTGRTSGPNLEEARLNYERLSRSSAERVTQFWRGRAAAPAESA
jgi:uncharacterized protein (DUF2336 family)